MNISPEEKLVFTCLNADNGANKQAEMDSLIKTPINWNNVISILSYHQIAPLVYFNLNSLSALTHIPENIIKTLKKGYMRNSCRNILLWKEICSILDLVKEARFKVFPFRGIVLSNLIYINPGLRRFADIDIMIKKEDLIKLRIILLNRGYNEARTDRVFRKLIASEIYSCLELHTMLAPPRPYVNQFPQLWKRVKSEIIDGQKIDCLSNEDTFLSLVLHLRRHTRILILKFIYDIARLLDLYRDIYDWKYIEDLARKNHIKNCIYFSIYIADELLGVSVSREIINRFSPRPFTKRMMCLCMNKYNFLRPRLWQGYILRVLLFDRIIDLFVYFLLMPIFKRRVE